MVGPMDTKLTPLEIALLEAELDGKCVHKVFALNRTFSICYKASCDGYGAYDIDGEVHFCPEYRRLKGKKEE